MIYSRKKLIFEDIVSPEEWYSLVLQRTYYVIGSCILVLGHAGDGAAISEAVEHSDEVYKALRYLASSIPRTLHSSVKHSQLHVLRDSELGDWVVVAKCWLEKGKLLMVFQDFL